MSGFDWSKAPEWAKFLGVNKDGHGHLFEEPPIDMGGYWCAPRQGARLSPNAVTNHPDRGQLFERPAEDIKINWRDSPKWANWFAIDIDGVGHFFEEEPTLMPAREHARAHWSVEDGKRVRIGFYGALRWQLSKIRRPRNVKPPREQDPGYVAPPEAGSW